MARIHGKNGQVQMDPAGGSSLAVVANVNSFSINMSKERVEATCFGDTNKVRVVGLPDFSGNIGGFFNRDTVWEFFDVILGNYTPTLRLLPDSTYGSEYLQGLANLDGNLSVDNKGAVTFSGQWDAAGNWSVVH